MARAVRYCALALAWLASPAFAQSGQLTLAPEEINVDNTKQGAEVLLTYRPRTHVSALEAEYAINLDRFAWAEVQAIPSTSPEYQTNCFVTAGKVRAHVHAAAPLPAALSIPVCRIRVRTHAHTPRSWNTLSPVFAYELEPLYLTYPVVTNSTRIYVP